MSKIVIGHKNPDTDSICSSLGYAALLSAKGEDAVACRCGEVSKETQYALDYFKVAAPKFIEKVEEGQEVFMVDHNEFPQAVDGIESAALQGIIDHHKMDLHTASPMFIHTEAVGCTATIVSNMHWCQGVEMAKETAGLLLSAIISDTLLFKSPTCTEKDKKTAAKLAEIAGVDLNAYGMEMLKAGAGVGYMTPAEIAKNDSKPFTFGKYKAIVSQISVMDPAEVMALKDLLLVAMSNMCKHEGYDLSLVMVTDIMNESTDLLYVGEPKQLLADAFGKAADGDCMHLPGVVSRKKQIVPQLTEAAAKL